MNMTPKTKFSGILYLDQDGVLAGCDEAAAKFLNISIKEFGKANSKNSYWKHLIDTVDVEHFFATLPWEPKGKKLLVWVQAAFKDVQILTRPVEAYHAACVAGKKTWLSANFLSMPVIFEKDKEKYALSNGVANILIDDSNENIEKWIKAGGIGIHYNHHCFDDVITKLKSIRNGI